MRARPSAPPYTCTPVRPAAQYRCTIRLYTAHTHVRPHIWRGASIIISVAVGMLVCDLPGSIPTPFGSVTFSPNAGIFLKTGCAASVPMSGATPKSYAVASTSRPSHLSCMCMCMCMCVCMRLPLHATCRMPHASWCAVHAFAPCIRICSCICVLEHGKDAELGKLRFCEGCAVGFRLLPHSARRWAPCRHPMLLPLAEVEATRSARALQHTEIRVHAADTRSHRAKARSAPACVHAHSNHIITNAHEASCCHGAVALVVLQHVHENCLHLSHSGLLRPRVPGFAALRNRIPCIARILCSAVLR